MISSKKYGGWGSGKLGDVVSDGGVINTYAKVLYISNSYSLVLSEANSAFTVGKQVLFYIMDAQKEDLDGVFSVNTISAVNGTKLNFVEPLPVSNANGIAVAQVILIPEYNTFTLTPGKTLTCKEYDLKSGTGGVVIVKAKESVNLSNAVIDVSKKTTNFLKSSHGTVSNEVGNKKIPMGEGSGLIILISPNIILSNAVLGTTKTPAKDTPKDTNSSIDRNNYSRTETTVYNWCSYESVKIKEKNYTRFDLLAGVDKDYRRRLNSRGEDTTDPDYNRKNSSDYPAGACVVVVSKQIVGMNASNIRIGGYGYNGALSPYGSGVMRQYNHDYEYWNNTSGASSSDIQETCNGGGNGGYAYVVQESKMDPPNSGFVTDTIQVTLTTLVTSKTGWNTNGLTSVEGFNISGSEPSGTSRRIAFTVDGKHYTINNGAPAEMTGEFNIDTILANGNSVGSLTSVTNIPTWVNKVIYPSVAMSAPDDAKAFPTLKMSLKVRNNQDRFTEEKYSGEYVLNATDEKLGAEIVDIVPDTTVSGGASVNIQGAIKINGTWGGWQNLSALKGKRANAIKYHYVYKVPSFGSNIFAQVNSVKLTYLTGKSVVTSTTADLITKTQEYQNELHYAQVILQHQVQQDSNISVYASFRSRPSYRKLLNIGVANGATQVIKLLDKNINSATISVQLNGNETNDFSFNTINNTLTIKAPSGTAITTSYEYNYEPEEWKQMDLVSTQDAGNGIQTSKYQYNMVNDGKTISCAKVVLERPTGTTKEVLGVGSGVLQRFSPSHQVLEKKINLIYDGKGMQRNYTYDETSNVISLYAPAGAKIECEYSWVAETPEIYNMYCGWAE